MPKAPKLRKTCNNCMSARVRCKKISGAFLDSLSLDPQTCLRCIRKNAECIYGVLQSQSKPYQPYPNSKPTNVAQNASNSEEPQSLDNDSNNDNGESINVAHNQSLDGDCTNKDATSQCPEVGRNLSDSGPELGSSSVSQNPTDDFQVILPRKHDMCSVMSYLRKHLLKLQKLLNSTYDSEIPKSAADEYTTTFRAIRATIQQLLRCICRTCCSTDTRYLLLATLSFSLSESYRDILMNFGAALYEVREDLSKLLELRTFGLFLRTELGHFREICSVIREDTSKYPEIKAVGEAYYEVLKEHERRWTSLLNIHLSCPYTYELRRAQTTNSVTESVSSQPLDLATQSGFGT